MNTPVSPAAGRSVAEIVARFLVARGVDRIEQLAKTQPDMFE